ncbi:MAG: SDR family oxidoreductase [Bacteroidales bacterium]|jgi:NAD(P)-dependent dehydrogenase (short-subunit alcohol dehydrogenase family)|nr:SDR family oxidoreductase [Bacteroidales bacterium]MBR1501679.1 SDR family oxidoreductase [Bacteroidales bacterium]MBR1893792.1 SDR family oxidoreductase [Bacteroidales bacterium]
MAQNLFDINGKVTVMTGACGVLGATIVKYFASQGSKVVLLDLERARETGERIVAEIKAAGGEAMFLPTNVLDEATVEQNCKDIVAAYGSVDILLNGAGGNMGPANVAPDQTIFDMDLDATRKVFELNIIGAIIPTKVFAKVMVANKKGSIVNFCSMSSFRPLTRVAGYGMAKSALASWTQWLAGELATKFGAGLRVNAIAPGFLLTNQNRSLLTNPDGSLTDRSHKIIGHTPFGRFLEPDELVGALHYLASDASKGVTGTIAVVDGGFNSFSI